MKRIILLTAIAIALAVVYFGPEVAMTFDPATVVADCGTGSC
jgi:hypothetical protein